MYFHSIIISLFQQSMFLSRTYRHDPPMTARQQCVVSASTITRFIWHYRSSFTLSRIVSVAFHPIFLAALVHLANLSHKECQEGFVQCAIVLSEISKKWPICRFLLHVLVCISRQETQHELRQDLLEILEAITPNLSETEIEEGTSIYPIAIDLLDVSRDTSTNNNPHSLGLSDFISQSLRSEYTWGKAGSKRQKMKG